MPVIMPRTVSNHKLAQNIRDDCKKTTTSQRISGNRQMRLRGIATLSYQ
jgi:hypothetical protein